MGIKMMQPDDILAKIRARRGGKSPANYSLPHTLKEFPYGLTEEEMTLVYLKFPVGFADLDELKDHVRALGYDEGTVWNLSMHYLAHQARAGRI
jgi:hypothetical protein